uniref:Putative secreted protein n=1 Tax=Ixodes ricinus TaxID=34613 RepID=A0A6B0UCA6_IXORI
MGCILWGVYIFHTFCIFLGTILGGRLNKSALARTRVKKDVAMGFLLRDMHVPQILGNVFGTDESNKEDMEVVLKKSSNLVGSSVRAVFRVIAK